MRLLIIEDEPALRAAVAEAMTGVGHAVDEAPNGHEGLAMLRAFPYDAAILDIGLPGLDGLSLCREVRALGMTVPILLLTARDTLKDKVEGLDAGADDYLVKPFELDELLARVRALLRRHAPRKESVLAVADLRLDPATGEAWRAGRKIELPRKERALLEYLMRNAGRLVSRDQILLHVWDSPDAPESDVVRAHIKLLRKAIGDVGSPRLIQTVHGLGYRMADHAPDASA
ncbi:MAG: response regulator transcription factor [Candidatus Sericytochromatia bacterium]